MTMLPKRKLLPIEAAAALDELYATVRTEQDANNRSNEELKRQAAAAEAAARDAKAIADSIGATGLVYLGSPEADVVRLGVITPQAAVINRESEWGLIGNFTGPSVVIGGDV